MKLIEFLEIPTYIKFHLHKGLQNATPDISQGVTLISSTSSVSYIRTHV
jgi:hypothetical protein